MIFASASKQKVLNDKNLQLCVQMKIHNFFSKEVEIYIYFGLEREVSSYFLTTVY